MEQKNWAGGGSGYQLNEGVVLTNNRTENIRSIYDVACIVLVGYSGNPPATFDNKEFVIQVGKQVSANYLHILFKIYDPIEWSQNSMEHEILAGFTTQVVYTETRILSSADPDSIRDIRQLIEEKMIDIYNSYK